MSVQLIIHPDFDTAYDGFYLKGFKEIFPNLSIRFDHKKFFFKKTKPSALILNYNGKKINIIIDSRDFDTIEEHLLEWANVYAKVNININKNELTTPLISIAPSFGIKHDSNVKMLATCGLQMLHCKSLKKMKAAFLNTYTILKHRYSEDEYLKPAAIDPLSIFFKATLWKDNDVTTKTRAEFIRIARTLKDIKFEGGFAKRVDGDTQGYDDLIDGNRISFKEYLDKTKRSLLVFNTPAVAQCHGWKLGEFLALGKAIISMPLTRALPAPLIHGTHLHIVNNVSEIQNAVDIIYHSQDYRKHLESNAGKYYKEFASAKASVAHILNAAGLDVK